MVSIYRRSDSSTRLLYCTGIKRIMDTVIIISAVALIGLVAWKFVRPSKVSQGSGQGGSSGSIENTKTGEKERQK